MLPSSDSLLFVDPNSIHIEETLIDIRTEEDFLGRHLDHAKNFCVYEVVFVEKVKKAYPDLSTPIIVYGQNNHYKGSEYAFQKLTLAGYSNVRILKGGLEAILGPIGTDPWPSGQLKLDTGKSLLRWFGRNLLNEHEGTLQLTEGSILIGEDQRCQEAWVAVDMTKMDCTDLTEEGGKRGLINHLSNTDFFDVSNYPQSCFELKEMTPFQDTKVGIDNHEIKGIFEIRGIRREFSFPAHVYALKEGLGLQAQFNFDRTKWGALYGSASIFESLGMHVVCDLVTLNLRLVFKR